MRALIRKTSAMNKGLQGGRVGSAKPHNLGKPAPKNSKFSPSPYKDISAEKKATINLSHVEPKI